jgi:hypothetical protein
MEITDPQAFPLTKGDVDVVYRARETAGGSNKPSLARLLLVTEPPGILEVTGPGIPPSHYESVPHEEGALGVTMNSSVNGPFVWSGSIDDNNIDGCDSFSGQPFLNSVALFSKPAAGQCPNLQQVLNAAAGGAKALVIYNNDYSGLEIMTTTFQDATIPTVFVTKTDGDLLVNWCDAYSSATVELSPGRSAPPEI